MALESLLNKEISKLIITNAPLDVIKFWKEYPDYVRKTSNFYFKVDLNNKHWTDIDAPYYGLTDHSANEMIKSSKDYEFICNLYHDMRKAQKKYNEMFHKIECALNSLRTYNRIKENFPEAYAVLIEKVDKETLIENSENLCDSVENIRAELSAKK